MNKTIVIMRASFFVSIVTLLSIYASNLMQQKNQTIPSSSPMQAKKRLSSFENTSANTQKESFSSEKKNNEQQTIVSLANNQSNIIPLSIGFVDTFDAMGNCKEGEKVRQEIEKKQDTLAKTLQEEKQKIEKSINEYKVKVSMLNDNGREKEEKQIRVMERDYQNKLQESEYDLKKEAQRQTTLLTESALKAAEVVAQKNNLDAVIDKETGKVMYVSEKLDYTIQLKTEMNTEYIAKNTTTASASKTKIASTSLQQPQVLANKGTI